MNYLFWKFSHAVKIPRLSEVLNKNLYLNDEF